MEEIDKINVIIRKEKMNYENLIVKYVNNE